MTAVARYAESKAVVIVAPIYRLMMHVYGEYDMMRFHIYFLLKLVIHS